MVFCVLVAGGKWKEVFANSLGFGGPTNVNERKELVRIMCTKHDSQINQPCSFRETITFSLNTTSYP
jgi:hypothetical protein